MSHRILAAGAVALATLATTSSVHAADNISLRLNWLISGQHTPFYLGVQEGYFEEEGIVLDINEGKGSAIAMQVVAAKGDTFGISTSDALIAGATAGQPVTAVMSLINSSSLGVISLDGSGIASAKDLEGKTIAATAGDALTQLFPAVVAANGLDESKINLVFMDPAAKVIALMEGKVDALLGGVQDQPFLLEEQGFTPSILPFSAIGANTVSITLHTHNDNITDNPDLVQRMVRATMRSWEHAVRDPAAAAEATLGAKSELSMDVLVKQLTADASLMNSANTEGQPIGFAAIEDWSETLEILKNYKDLDTDRTADSYFTNDFVLGATN